ncbi:MAG: PQQ-dependent sugar dehydrogenase [Bacteroidota bacterium]
MEVLDEGLNEPGEMDFLPNGNIIFTERRGNVKIYNPATRSTKVAGTIDVYTKSEDGLLGVALDPDFATNHVLYLYYSPNIERSINILSSFVMRGDSLLLASEKQLLEVEVQRRECCHTGGSIQFGPDGNLFLSTGDNTNPFETRYAPINEVANRGPWDAQKSSANTNDLRGKILRIRPNDQGGYDIPDGNLFPKDGSAGRPEIYVMGCRNPYRISIDRKNRYLYWGDVGPDGRVDSTRGPKGYDEINQARQPGFFGWPLFIGNNKAYRDVDFATQKLGDWFDPKNPVNDSPNNTGLKALPPAKPAFIWYPYDESKEFPIVGKGGRNAMAGPVYYHDLFAGAESQFPAYYDGKLFIYDFMRDWVFAVSMDENNNLETIEPFLPELKLSSPMDMEFGPDGALYVLEYGTQWFAANPDARLIRISYADGNRKPVAMIQTDRHIGAAPFTVQFSARSSFDHDPEDQLQYRWEFPDGSTQEGVQVNYTFQDNGNFHPKLTVRDGQGGESSTEIEIQVGNAPPKIEVKLDGNQTFFWKDRSIDYSVEVSDQEDGSLSSGGISPNDVRITFGFLGNTKDRTQADQDHAATALASMIKTGGELIGTSGCTACHGVENEVVGPAYQKVSARYENQADAEAYLIRKILEGGQGVWGGKAMPAQSQLSDDQAKSMALYILSLAKKEKPLPSLPSNGRLLTNQHQGLGEGSSYTFQVSYEDRGGEAIGPLAAYESITLRPAQITAAEIDPVQSQDIEIRTNGRAKPPHKQARLKEGSYAYFAPVDLTGIVALSMRYDSPAAGRTLEVRLDSPNGPLYTSFTSQATKGKFIIDEHQVNPVEGEHALYLLAKTGSGPEDSRVLASFHWMYMQNGQES